MTESGKEVDLEAFIAKEELKDLKRIRVAERPRGIDQIGERGNGQVLLFETNAISIIEERSSKSPNTVFNQFNIDRAENENIQQTISRVQPDFNSSSEEVIMDANAQNDRGEQYAYGRGVPQSYEEAVKWFTKAAEQGHALGQSNLGLMYRNGWGVDKSYEEAMKWFTKAAEQGNAEGQCKLAFMYKNGNGVPQSYRDAVEWYRKAAEQGNSNGQYRLGEMYLYGWGVPQSAEEAVKWYRKAAEQGHAEGQFDLGLMYRNGWGVKKSYKEAAKWYTKAAEQGHDTAKVALEKLSQKRTCVIE